MSGARAAGPALLAAIGVATAAAATAAGAERLGGAGEVATVSRVEVAAGPRLEVVAVPRIEDAGPAVPGLGARLAEIRQRIAAALRYPPIARLREVGGETRVRFEIGPSRRARKVVVAASSGVPSLDRAAARAVLEAGELPYVHGTLEVPVHFDLTPRP